MMQDVGQIPHGSVEWEFHSPWRTVGMPAPSSSSPAISVQRIDDIGVTLVFFRTFEELPLPIKGPMEDAGVIKLYEPSPTPCLYVAPARNLLGRVPLIQLFLDCNSTPTIPHKFSKRKDSAFPCGCADAAALTDGAAAMSTKLTHGCGSLDAASPG